MWLLPRSVRGTWLLAGAVWLAACGAFWWLLPPQPRWRLPALTWFLGFLADGRTGVSNAYGATGPQGPIQVWDMPTGQLRASHFGPQDQFQYAYLAAGDRLVLISKPDPSSTRVRVVNPVSGAEALSLTFQTIPDDWWVCLQPNGRLLACPSEDGGRSRIVWYDLEAAQAVGTIEGPSRTARFSPDGRWFAAQDLRSGGASYQVLSVPSGREHLSIPTPGTEWPPWFSPNGSFLLVRGTLVPNGPEELRVFDLATGQVRLRLPDGAKYAVFTPDSTRLVVEQGDPDGCPNTAVRRGWLCWYDLATGRECAPRCPASTGVYQCGGMDWATPDGRHLGLVAWYERPAVYKWLARIPLFADDDALVSMREEFQLRETDTGRLIGRWPASQVIFNADASLAVSMHTSMRDNVPRVWDVPPLKPVSWLAGFAAASAFLLTWLARRRVPRLRRLAEAAV